MLDMLCSPLFGFASRLSWIAWHGGLTLSAVLLVVTGLSSDARLLMVAFVPLAPSVLLSIGLEAYSGTVFVAPRIRRPALALGVSRAFRVPDDVDTLRHGDDAAAVLHGIRAAHVRMVDAVLAGMVRSRRYGGGNP